MLEMSCVVVSRGLTALINSSAVTCFSLSSQTTGDKMAPSVKRHEVKGKGKVVPVLN